MGMKIYGDAASGSLRRVTTLAVFDGYGLPDATGDTGYMEALARSLPPVLDDFAPSLAGREVLLGVDGQSEDVAPSCGKGRCAIALVDVKIEDKDARDITLRDEPVGGECEIVEDAITRTGVGQGMVAAASGVRGIPVLQRQLRREPCSAGRELRTRPPHFFAASS